MLLKLESEISFFRKFGPENPIFGHREQNVAL